MTTKERFLRMYQHKEADRIPIIDHPWGATIERWQREGLPVGMDWRDYFDVDKVEGIYVDYSPRYESKILEETEKYKILTTNWGVTLKVFKHDESTPEFLDFKVNTKETWEEAKKLMTFDSARIPFAHLEQNYKHWKQSGAWISGQFWFGFDVTHSWMAGTETILMALLEEPEWCEDMFNHYLDMNIMHFEEILKKGYEIDEIYWPDDMGYKNTQFFSMRVYRELLKPVQKRAIDWCHSKGLKVRMHSCGDIMPFVPELVELGLDALNPLEVKAGMDPILLKKQFGDKLVLNGGINAAKWHLKDEILSEMEMFIPILKQNGGYIFSSDHSVPSSVSLEEFGLIIDKAKQLGKY